MFKKKENNSEKEWKRKAIERQRENKRIYLSQVCFNSLESVSTSFPSQASL